MVGSFITDHINYYTLAQSEVPNMYIVGGVGFGAKKLFFPFRPKICRPTKKISNIKCLKKHSGQFLFNMFCCEINNNKKNLAPKCH